MALLLSGCSSQPNQNERNRTIKIVQSDEPRRLDPAFIKDYYEGVVSGFIYDGLVQFDKGSVVRPALAESWEISPDGREYTFHLREAKFSDGRPVTSADVRYSFTRVLRPETRSDRKWVLDRIEGADEVTSGLTTELRGLQTPDPRTVEVTLKKPFPAFLTMLAMPTGCIIPANSAGSDKPDPRFNEHPIGSGPWMLDTWLQYRRLEFTPNPNYWGRRPQADRLLYIVLSEGALQRQEFVNGNVDVYLVAFNVYSMWMKDPARAAMTTTVQELRTDYIGFMNNKPALADPRVRRAITHAVNRQDIFTNLQKKRGELAHGPVPPGIVGYRPDVAPLAYDPDLARKLLKEAGVSKLSLTLWYRDEAQNSEIASSARSDLEKIGIEIIPTPRDLAALRTAIWEGKPDLFIGSWSLDYPDIENALVPTFHSRNIPRQGNGSHFSDPVVDKLLDDAQTEADPERRIRKYQAAEDAIIERCPWMPLFHRKSYYAVQPRLKAWTPALMYNAERWNETTE